MGAGVMDDRTMCGRWRLILGDFAEERLPLERGDGELDGALAFLYDREYGSGQGVRQDGSRQGGRGVSMLAVPAWMRRVKKLFPKRTVEIMQKQALDKYQMTELLTDETVLREMEPSLDLLKSILTFRSIMPQNVKKLAYEIVEQVVRDITKKLEIQVKRVFYGKKLPNSTTSYKIYRNFDVKRTIQKNLKHYDPQRKTVAVEHLYFNQNVKRYNPWNIIILVDESGSMMNSVIYSAVMASIFSKLPFVSVKLAIFDTAVVDLSEHLSDPVGILMKVQLGGGTDIHRALEYGKKLTAAPQKTIVVLVSDLYDGNNYRMMYRSCRDIIEAGSKMFVLPALDYAAAPCYDKTAAKKFASLGADVAAITPEELSEWIGKIIS